MSFSGFSIKCTKFMEKEIDFYDFKSKKYLEKFLNHNFEITQILTTEELYSKYFTRNKKINDKVLSFLNNESNKVILGITCQDANKKQLNIIFNFDYDLLEIFDFCEFLKNNDVVIVSSKIWSWGKTFESKFLNIISNKLDHIELNHDVSLLHFKNIEIDDSESLEDESSEEDSLNEQVNNSNAVHEIMTNIIENQKAMSQTHMNQMNILMNLMSKINQ